MSLTAPLISLPPGASSSNSPSGDSDFVPVSGNEQLVVPNGKYIATNAGETTFVLPEIFPIGKSFEIVQRGSGTFRVTQKAGQSIRIGELGVSTVGVAGSIASTDAGAALKATCVVANLTFIATHHESVLVTA